MSIPFSAVAGVEIVVGATTETTAKIGVCSLRGGTIAVDFAGSVSVGAWTDMGADNPAQSGKHVCSVATVTISGLAANSAYSGSITCDGVTHAFSFRTRPVAGQPFAFAMWSCERQTDIQYKGPGPWRRLKQQIEGGAGQPFLFTACIDDPCYAYLVDNIEDAASGLAPISSAGVSETEWDYAVAWCMWFGLIDDKQESRQSTYPERLWVRHHCSHLVMWGDNEVDANHGRDVDQGGRKTPRDAAYWPTALHVYKKMCADFCSPEFLGDEADTGLGWAFTAGDCAFASPDINSFVLPFNAENAGDTHDYGRAWSTVYTADAVVDTVPSRTDIGWAFPFAPAVCYGLKQCDAILQHYADAAKPVNVLFTPNGLEFENEPHHVRWPDECDYLFARKDGEFVWNGDFMIGDDGWTANDAQAVVTAWHESRTYQNCIEVENGDASQAFIYQQLEGLTPGEEYTLSLVRIAGACRVRVGATPGGTDYLSQALPSTPTPGAHSYTFTPAVSNPYLSLMVDSSASGTPARYDKVSVAGPGGKPGGLLVSDRTNGTDGALAILKGDTHSCRVLRYTANGVDKFCNTALADGELWEINPGTMTGSGSHRNATGVNLTGGAELRFEQVINYVTPTEISTENTGRVATFAVGVVSDGQIDITVHNCFMRNKTPWRGTFAPGSNAPTYPKVKTA